MTNEQLDLAAALREVNQGEAAAAAAAPPDWWKRAVRAVLWLAREGTPFQAHDIVERFGLDEPDNPASQWGALFGALSKAGLIETAGYAQSKRPTARGSAVRTWRGTPKTTEQVTDDVERSLLTIEKRAGGDQP
jgi:hypothetical protein